MCDADAMGYHNIMFYGDEDELSDALFLTPRAADCVCLFFNAPALRRAHYLAIKRVAKLILSLHFLCVFKPGGSNLSPTHREGLMLLTGT